MRIKTLPALTAAALLLGASAAPARQSGAPGADAPDPAAALTGKAAPPFTLPDQNDKPRSLAESRGKWVVLAFYPLDKSKG